MIATHFRPARIDRIEEIAFGCDETRAERQQTHEITQNLLNPRLPICEPTENCSGVDSKRSEAREKNSSRGRVRYSNKAKKLSRPRY